MANPILIKEKVSVLIDLPRNTDHTRHSRENLPITDQVTPRPARSV